MVIALRAVGTPVTSAQRTTTVINMPAGVQAGDQVIVLVNVGGSPWLPLPPTITTAPASLTAVANVNWGKTAEWMINMRAYRYTVVGTGDPTSFSFIHQDGSSDGIAIAYSGVDTTTPLDVTATANSGTGASATATGLTTTLAGVMLIAFRNSWDGNAITPPAGWTERLDQPISWVGEQIDASVGASGNFTIPSGNTDGISPWGAILIALRPAGGGSSTAGTLSGSLPRATSTLGATVTLPGLLSASVPRATSTIAGSVQTGTLNGSLPRATSTVPGTVTVQGSMSGALPRATAAILDENTADIAASIPRATASITGTVTSTITGTMGGTLPRATSSAVAIVTVQGSVNAPAPRATSAIIGSVGSTIAGAVIGTLPTITGAVAGAVRTGTVSGSLPRITGALGGTITSPIAGTLAASLPRVKSSISTASPDGTKPLAMTSITGAPIGVEDINGVQMGASMLIL